MNVKYDDDKMNPFMSDWSECKWFVRPEIPSYTGPPQSGTCLTQGETTLFVIRIHRHIHITYKWNLSLTVEHCATYDVVVRKIITGKACIIKSFYEW